jgi:HEAT repeat protein
MLQADVLTASIAMAVTYSVIGMFVIVVFMFLGLIVLRIVGDRRERAFEGKAEEIRPAVYELLTGDSPAGEVVAELHATIPMQDRRALEYVLLENARVLKGRELEILTMVFEQLGYADKDITTVRHGRDIKKAESAFHLGTMRTARAVPYLVSALDSRSPEVKFSTLNALSKIGTPDAIAAVMEYLATDNELETMRVAEVILERKQAFSPYLEEWLKRGEADIPRLELLIDLVGVMKDARTVPVLFDYLAHENPAVRARATSALGSIGDISACDRLEIALFDDDSGVRAEAASALGKVQCIEAIPLLKCSLADPDLAVKMNSAQALTQLGEEGQTALEEGLLATEEQERGVVTEVLAVQQVRNGEGG